MLHPVTCSRQKKAHGKQIQDFAFSPIDEISLLASSTRTDSLIRLWTLPKDIPRSCTLQQPRFETDMPDAFLAGHEKRVDLVRFHPTCPGIVVSCSVDATVKLWSVESLQDRVTLWIPDESPACSLAFDYEGSTMCVSTVSDQDASIHHYDPRAASTPTCSFPTGLAPTRGCRLSWLHPDPLVVAVGFDPTSKNERCIHMWDTRMIHTSTASTSPQSPIQAIHTEGTGVGILEPFWDPALPILYLTARGEGLRMYELINGVLTLATTLKIEKHAVAIEALPKGLCDARKCEIGRFIRLGTDSTIELTSVIVPRVNSESVFQDDLFPCYSAINRNIISSQWFDESISVEPWMLDMKEKSSLNPNTTSVAAPDTLATMKSHTNSPLEPQTGVSIVDESIITEPMDKKDTKVGTKSGYSGGARPSVGSIRRSGTLCRTSTSQGRPGGHSRDLSTASACGSVRQSTGSKLGVPSTLTDSQEISHDIPLIDGILALETKTWLSVTYNKVYVSIKPHRIYIGSDENADSPMRCISLDDVQSVTKFEIGIPSSNTDVGFSLNLHGVPPMRFQADSQISRDQWVDNLHLRLNPNRPISEHSTSITPPKPIAISQVLQAIPPASPKSRLNPLGTGTGMGDSHGIASTPISTVPQSSRYSKASQARLIGRLLLLTDSTTQRNSVMAWTPRIVVLEEDGTIHLHANDAKGYTHGLKPISVINLSVAVSVRVAQCHMASGNVATTGGNITDTDRSDVYPIMFHINTLNRVYHFRAKCMRDAYDWVTQIGEVVRNTGVAPFCEVVFDTVTEGIVCVESVESSDASKQTGCDGGADDHDAHVALAVDAPLGLDVGTYWLSLIHGSLYYYSSEISCTPIRIYRPWHIQGYTDQVLGDSTTPQVGFSLQLSGNSFTIRHSVKEHKDHSAWLTSLDLMLCSHFDLLGRMNIHSLKDLSLRLSNYQSTHGHFVSGNRSSTTVSPHLLNTVSSVITTIPNDKLPYTVIDQDRIAKDEQKNLIRLSGKVHLTIVTVAAVWNSISHDSAYVLDVGSDVYHWGGDRVSRVCRAQALDVATRIRKSRGNRPRIVLVEREDTVVWSEFLKHLGAPKHEYVVEPPAVPVSFDAIHKADHHVSGDHNEGDPAVLPTRVYIIDPNAILVSRKVALVFRDKVYPSKTLLESASAVNGCAVVHADCEVLIWSCKHATTDARALAAFVAHHIATSHALNSPLFVSLHYETQALESVVFKEKFSDFEGTIPICMRIDPVSNPNIAPTSIQAAVDINCLLAAPPVAIPRDVDLLDVNGGGGKGEWTMYRIKQFTREQVIGPLLDGQLFRGESYIIAYTYRPQYSGVDKCVCYFWQGSASSITEKGTSALMTIELSTQCGLEVSQVRVIEGKEPQHLFKVFHGIYIMLGSHSLSCKPNESEMIVFDIRDVYENVSKAVQVEQGEVTFNSNHVLVFLMVSATYIWLGKYSSSSELAKAQETAHRFGTPSCSIVLIKDNSDVIPPELMTRLDFYRVGHPNKQVWTSRTQPKLFLCSDANGSIEVAHVPAFIQEDLDPNSVMILDAVTHIFVWIGSTSKPSVKLYALETATTYINSSTTHDKKRVLLAVTFQGQEPPEFTSQFHGWTKSKIAKDKMALKPRVLPLEDVLKEYKRESYSIHTLLSDNVPGHLDRTKLEMYLSEDDFVTVFHMTRDEYMAVVPWKREGIKKQAGFY
ncbi:hypothetical protein BSLG_006243 [Batrachochytrium salamandrivorans]|nr:hypothetical protein BASA83_003950 [Batrachochytrium salamandrivorans]KAJ1339105.1 hypothetical protein BSLG_006243 [Batrachochytrium salamandrivorans]